MALAPARTHRLHRDICSVRERKDKWIESWRTEIKKKLYVKRGRNGKQFIKYLVNCVKQLYNWFFGSANNVAPGAQTTQQTFKFLYVYSIHTYNIARFYLHPIFPYIFLFLFAQRLCFFSCLLLYFFLLFNYIIFIILTFCLLSRVSANGIWARKNGAFNVTPSFSCQFSDNGELKTTTIGLQ